MWWWWGRTIVLGLAIGWIHESLDFANLWRNAKGRSWRIAGRDIRLHPLKGERKGQWAISVSGNWRLVFEFDEGNIANIDLVDYH